MPTSNRASGDELFESLRLLRRDVDELQRHETDIDDAVESSIRYLQDITVTDALLASARGTRSSTAGSRAYLLAPTNYMRTLDWPGGSADGRGVGHEGEWTVTLRDCRIDAENVESYIDAPMLPDADSRAVWRIDASATSSTTDGELIVRFLGKPPANTSLVSSIWARWTIGRAGIVVGNSTNPGGVVSGDAPDPWTSTVDTPAQFIKTHTTHRAVNNQAAYWRMYIHWIVPAGRKGTLWLGSPRAERGSTLGDASRYVKLGASTLS